MVASAADVGGGGGPPITRIIQSYVAAAQSAFGGRTPQQRALNAARNYGFDSPQFARFVREYPKAAEWAVNEFNRRGRADAVQTRGPNVGQPLFPGATPGAVSWAAIVQMYGGDPQINTPVRGTTPALENAFERATGEAQRGPTAADRAVRTGSTAADVAASRARLLGRIAGAAGLLLYPSEISPETPIPQRTPGPSSRGGARRPAGPVKQPTTAPVSGPGASPQPSPSPPVTYATPGPILTTPAGPVALPQPPELVLPTPTQVPSPALSVPPWARSVLVGLIPSLFGSSTPGGGRSFSDPLTPYRPPGVDPLTPGALTGSNPWGVSSPQPSSRNDRCDCRDQKRKRKKRKPRTECWQGTYTETPTGLTKRKRKKVTCRPSRKKLQSPRAR